MVKVIHRITIEDGLRTLEKFVGMGLDFVDANRDLRTHVTYVTHVTV